ncbi:MAG: hypothetical protein ACO1SV_03515 [Fimbriimonas sp.]
MRIAKKTRGFLVLAVAALVVGLTAYLSQEDDMPWLAGHRGEPYPVAGLTLYTLPGGAATYDPQVNEWVRRHGFRRSPDSWPGSEIVRDREGNMALVIAPGRSRLKESEKGLLYAEFKEDPAVTTILLPLRPSRWERLIRSIRKALSSP